MALGVPNCAVVRVESLPARVQSFSRLQTGARRQTFLEYAGVDHGLLTRLLDSVGLMCARGCSYIYPGDAAVAG